MEFCILAPPSCLQHILTVHQTNCQDIKVNFAAWLKTQKKKHMD